LALGAATFGGMFEASATGTAALLGALGAKPSFWYHLLLALHLACIIGGFGYLAFSGVFFSGVRRQGDAALSGALEVNRSLSQLAELLVIAALVFGIAAVGASHTIKFSQGWVGGVIAAWVVDFGVLHGLIRRKQRRYVSVAATLAPVDRGAPAPPEVVELDSLERAMSAGWGVFNLVAVVAIVLTVFQPGG
jgi:hypothetical protein